MEPKILTYRDDPRVKSNHFILSEINRAFLEEHEIEGTVEDFKERVRHSRYEFKAVTGNTKKGTQRTKVYDINKFIQKAQTVLTKLEELQDKLNLELIPHYYQVEGVKESLSVTEYLITLLIAKFKRGD